MSIVQNPSAVESSDLQTELERTKERFENCIIKKETEYAKLWNGWYKKCEECKYDKISYDKAYNNMQHQIKQLQAQLGDLKGKSMDTQCASNTLDPLSQKLEDENVSLEFQVLNYAKENAHLKTTYKNPFDSINLRAQLFEKVSEQKATTKGIDNIAKNRRPQPMSNIKNDRVPSASKSSCIKNKEVEVEDHHRNLLLSKNKKHMSSECRFQKEHLLCHPDISFLYVFGALCYPKNDHDDIRKLGVKGDIGFFIGYSANSCAYRVYNRRTRQIMETMNVTFDELSAMAYVHFSA
ncbi:hypothetical protein Tco_0630531 [Tanacetum coccineum]